jgi:hypothetical protein
VYSHYYLWSHLPCIIAWTISFSQGHYVSQWTVLLMKVMIPLLPGSVLNYFSYSNTSESTKMMGVK